MGFLSGLTDTIFGKDPSVTSTPTMTPEQQELLKQLLEGMIQPGAKNTPSKAYDKYTGQLTAPTSNLQNLSLSALEQMVLNEATGGVGSSRYYQSELDKIIKSGGSPIDIGDFFKNQVQDPMLKSFSDEVLPRLQGTFSGSSAFGSDKLKQQELLTQNLTKQLVGSRSEMAYKSETDALNRLMTALGLGSQIGTGTTANLTAALAAGKVPQETEQARLKADYEEFLRGQNAQQGDIAQIMAALNMSAFSPVVNPGTEGLLSSFVKGASSGAAKSWLG